MCFYSVRTVSLPHTEQWMSSVIHQKYQAVPSECVVTARIRFMYFAVVSKGVFIPIAFPLAYVSTNAHQR